MTISVFLSPSPSSTAQVAQNKSVLLLPMAKTSSTAQVAQNCGIYSSTCPLKSSTAQVAQNNLFFGLHRK